MTWLAEKFRGLISRRRTGYAVVVAVAAAMIVVRLGAATATQQMAVLGWKLLLVSVAVVFAHIIRKQLFHYIDLSGHVEDGEDRVARALIFLAVTLFYCTIIFALTQGL